MSRAHRLRAAIGTALIALADRIMPPAPTLDDATTERIYQRLMQRIALQRMGDARNGHHRPPDLPI